MRVFCLIRGGGACFVGERREQFVPFGLVKGLERSLAGECRLPWQHGRDG